MLRRQDDVRTLNYAKIPAARKLVRDLYAHSNLCQEECSQMLVALTKFLICFQNINPKQPEQKEALHVIDQAINLLSFSIRATLQGMTDRRSLMELITNYNSALPRRLRKYLNDRGISNVVIDYHLLGWNSWWNTIPIFNRGGDFTFLQMARDPEDKSQRGHYIGHKKTRPSGLVVYNLSLIQVAWCKSSLTGFGTASSQPFSSGKVTFRESKSSALAKIMSQF